MGPALAWPACGAAVWGWSRPPYQKCRLGYAAPLARQYPTRFLWRETHDHLPATLWKPAARRAASDPDLGIARLNANHTQLGISGEKRGRPGAACAMLRAIEETDLCMEAARLSEFSAGLDGVNSWQQAA